MSWNAHTDYVFNQMPGQLKLLSLTGPDGSGWGSSGSGADKFLACDVSAACKSPANGLKEGSIKYMFLRNMDEISAFNNKGTGAAVLKGTQYLAVAVAAEGYKAEQCVVALEKLKSYLSGIGYN